MTRLGFILSVLLLFPGTAQAAERWASPSGAGTDCTQAAPCDAPQAFAGSSAGDDIVLAGGVYQLPGANLAPNGPDVTVRGQDAAAAPVLHLGSGWINVTGQLRDVEVRGESSAGLVKSNLAEIAIERVLAVNAGTGVACELNDVSAVVSDTACIAPSGTAISVQAGSSALLANVTAHGGTGLAVVHGSSADVHNTILSGITGGDVAASDVDTFVAVGYSNFDSTSAVTGAEIVELQGNQTAVSALVDAASGDVRQQAGSPTIDAGGPADGQLALGGLPRRLGDASDIGASELPHAPRVFTGTARAIGFNSAQLEAVTDGRGLPGMLRFEYGPTDAYGSVTSDVMMPAGFSNKGARLGGLTPGTIYHYRAVATHAGGTSTGRDATFTTLGEASRDTTRPVISHVGIRRPDGPTGLFPNGFLLDYRVSEPVFLLVTVQRAYSGRRKGGSCREAARRGRRCRIWRNVQVRSALNRAPGPGAIVFRRGLKPGRYRFSLQARDHAGNPSATVRLAHRVRRG